MAKILVLTLVMYIITIISYAFYKLNTHSLVNNSYNLLTIKNRSISYIFSSKESDNYEPIIENSKSFILSLAILTEPLYFRSLTSKNRSSLITYKNSTDIGTFRKSTTHTPNWDVLSINFWHEYFSRVNANVSIEKITIKTDETLAVSRVATFTNKVKKKTDRISNSGNIFQGISNLNNTIIQSSADENGGGFFTDSYSNLQYCESVVTKNINS